MRLGVAPLFVMLQKVFLVLREQFRCRQQPEAAMCSAALVAAEAAPTVQALAGAAQPQLAFSVTPRRG
ncbi:hypothetical protein ACP93_00485 [Xanthomonas sp. NCPPB 1128]|nr:hypothetical protein ACP93_00485 [Xanthomonas sp. NCPPB 1128]